MSTIAAILQEIATPSGAAPEAPCPAYPTVVITQGNARAMDVDAHIICIRMRTAGIIITPAGWSNPLAAGVKLWSPPDHAGWRLLDLLEAAGVNAVSFHAVTIPSATSGSGD